MKRGIIGQSYEMPNDSNKLVSRKKRIEVKMISAEIYKGVEMKRQNTKGHIHALNDPKSRKNEISIPGA